MINILKYICKILEFTCIFSILDKFTKDNSIIFCYHRISESSLIRQLEFIKSKYKIEHLNSILNTQDNNVVKNKINISITMDDCFEIDFYNMTKVCESIAIPCTFFVPTEYSKKNIGFWSNKLNYFFNQLEAPLTIIDFNGKKLKIESEKNKKIILEKWINYFLYNKMQTDKIEEKVDYLFIINKIDDLSDKIININTVKNKINNRLFSFQSHTSLHPKINLLNKTEFLSDVENSVVFFKQINENFDNYVFCYPYGTYHFISESHNWLEEMNFKYAVTLEKGIYKKNMKNMYLVPRIGLYENDNEFSITIKIAFAQFKGIFNL
jgi:hypothetical protein